MTVQNLVDIAKKIRRPQGEPLLKTQNGILSHRIVVKYIL